MRLTDIEEYLLWLPSFLFFELLSSLFRITTLLPFSYLHDFFNSFSSKSYHSPLVPSHSISHPPSLSMHRDQSLSLFFFLFFLFFLFFFLLSLLYHLSFTLPPAYTLSVLLSLSFSCYLSPSHSLSLLHSLTLSSPLSSLKRWSPWTSLRLLPCS